MGLSDSVTLSIILVWLYLVWRKAADDRAAEGKPPLVSWRGLGQTMLTMLAILAALAALKALDAAWNGAALGVLGVLAVLAALVMVLRPAG